MGLTVRLNPGSNGAVIALCPTLARTASLAATVVLLFLAGGPHPACASSTFSPSEPIIFHASKLEEMDAAITAAIADAGCPGAVLWLEREGLSYQKAYGRRAVVPAEEWMTPDTVFDAASLTKVVATTPAIMLLVERGAIDLDAPVATYLSEFLGDGRNQVTVRHLLTHTSGLRPGIPSRAGWIGYDNGIALALEERPTQPPGTAFRYSDVNFILLGELVRRVSALPLDQFAAREFYQPLRMRDTGFLPRAALQPRIAPTTQTGDHVLRGIVHDPTARRMGGVAGHAGLFTTATDLARFARMLLHGGVLEGTRVFQPETVRWMTHVQSPESVPDRRGLGWDIDSPYAGPRGTHFPVGSYGHTGWTGTSIWIDPFSETFVILLSNRNHPTEEGSVGTLRRRIGTLAAEAVAGFNYLHVPGALPRRISAEPATPLAEPQPRIPTVRVLNGVDVLQRERFAAVRGLRVGLITNQTGHDRDRRPTIDLLHEAPGVDLQALFSPEHGIRGVLDSNVSDSMDQRTGLPIYSLYGDRRKPSAEHLSGLDALVFDVQDIGCRFYTYISTLGLCLEAAAEANLKFFVLDRVNPINGLAIEGPVHQGDSRFIAYHSIPVRHAMTVGELARMFNAERGLNADLTVIQLEGWRRDLYFDQTSQPWTNPSPNMRNLTEAIFYPGIGLLETALSVGRGTDTPFEVIGAPYIDDVVLAEALADEDLPGVRFVPIHFVPRASVFQNQPCGGVYLMLTDRTVFNAVDVGITLALTLHRLYPGQFELDKVQTLLRHTPTIEAIREGRSLAAIKELWEPDLATFEPRRRQFLLYPPFR
jgi:uncharacterized protein YbbC (DUF1343 family)/CubicO group peptidase (beta-lactamase class C family)